MENCFEKSARPADRQFEHYVDEDYHLFDGDNVIHVYPAETVVGKKRLAEQPEIFGTVKMEVEKVSNSYKNGASTQNLPNHDKIEENSKNIWNTNKIVPAT